VSDTLRRHALVSVLLVAVAVAASIAVYPHLPAVVATHWDMHGVANGWSSRAVAVLLLPAMMVLVGGVVTAVGTGQPAMLQRTVATLRNVVLALMLAVHVAMLAVATSRLDHAAVPRIGAAMLALALIAVGNYMPRVTERNAFVGVRFPWAFASDEVWRRTQRAGGYGLVAVGVVGLAVAFAAGPSAAMPVLMGGLLVYVVALAAWSYRLARAAGR